MNADLLSPNSSVSLEALHDDRRIAVVLQIAMREHRISSLHNHDEHGVIDRHTHFLVQGGLNRLERDIILAGGV